MEAAKHKSDKTIDVEFVFKMSETQFPQMIMRKTAENGLSLETVVHTDLLSEI